MSSFLDVIDNMFVCKCGTYNRTKQQNRGFLLSRQRCHRKGHAYVGNIFFVCRFSILSLCKLMNLSKQCCALQILVWFEMIFGTALDSPYNKFTCFADRIKNRFDGNSTHFSEFNGKNCLFHGLNTNNSLNQGDYFTFIAINFINIIRIINKHQLQKN